MVRVGQKGPGSVQPPRGDEPEAASRAAEQPEATTLPEKVFDILFNPAESFHPADAIAGIIDWWLTNEHSIHYMNESMIRELRENLMASLCDDPRIQDLVEKLRNMATE